MKKIIATLIITMILWFGGMYLIAGREMRKTGSAQNGIASILATSSTVQIGPGTNKNILFTENTVCTSRVISTGANPIMLSFSRSNLTGSATTTTNPGPTIGFLQAASTTVAYDSGIYGCPAVSAYGYAASTTASIAEFQ